MGAEALASSSMNTILSAAEARGTEAQGNRMASTSASMEMNVEQPQEADGQFIRVIVADTQAIFRAGLRKIFALEDDIRVVGQSESLAQAQSAVKKFSCDVVIFEAALAPNPVEAVVQLLRENPQVRVVVVTPGADEELTLD